MVLKREYVTSRNKAVERRSGRERYTTIPHEQLRDIQKTQGTDRSRERSHFAYVKASQVIDVIDIPVFGLSNFGAACMMGLITGFLSFGVVPSLLSWAFSGSAPVLWAALATLFSAVVVGVFLLSVAVIALMLLKRDPKNHMVHGQRRQVVVD